MKLKGNLLLIGCLLSTVFTNAQLTHANKQFTYADTLRGSITKYRQGWDVLKYDLLVQPDIKTKSLTGKNTITYMEHLPVTIMQVDLQQPLIVDSVIGENANVYSFKRDGNVCFVTLRDSLATYKFAPGIRQITIWYHGVPVEAVRPPWDGGLIWKKDSKGNPLIGTACQGLGASVWWPCKDHQSDEPDSGMIIKIIAPDSLTAISNGRLINTASAGGGLRAWTWEVKNPINNYDVTMNVGKYANWSDTLNGEAGKLDLQYWVLDYNLDKAKKHFEQVKPMLRAFEYWFGKYPFYEDGYKLVETSFLGMEHQSAVAYGNQYKNGYLGKDMSASGWGLKWDFIIVHESGHEWFGNNITSNDLADMWLHEGFTNYSETLYTDYHYGKEAGNDYCFGSRATIKNDIPVIGTYGVNHEGSGDMYNKGGNMLHSIRNAINNDEKFRGILRGLNKTFYHNTVNTQQVEEYISHESGIDLSKVFDQYLRTTQVPVLEYYYSKKKQEMYYRYTNCVPGFNLPLVVNNNGSPVTITPGEAWKKASVTNADVNMWAPAVIERSYYLTMKQSPKKPRTSR